MPAPSFSAPSFSLQEPTPRVADKRSRTRKEKVHLKVDATYAKWHVRLGGLLLGRRASPAPVLFARLGSRGRRRRSRRRHARFNVAAEDHLAGRRLQHARDDDVDRLADHLARVVDDDHRPIVKIGDALVVLLAFFQDEHLHDLARQDHGLQRVRELVDVQHVYAAQLGDLVQVEVVRDDLALQRARQLDELEIHLAHVREVEVGNQHVHARHLLDLLQDVEPAAAAVALERVRRVGDELQLLQHELRNHERAVEEAGFADVGNAAVDDDAGNENLVAVLGAVGAEQCHQAGGLEPLTVLAADHEAEVRQHDQNEAVEKLDPAIAGIGPKQPGRDRPRNQQPDRTAKQRAQYAGHSCLAQPHFEQDHETGKREREPDVKRNSVEGQRPENGGGVSNDG